MKTTELVLATQSTIETTKKLAALVKDGDIHISQVPVLYHTFVVPFSVTGWVDRLFDALSTNEQDEIVSILNTTDARSAKDLLSRWEATPGTVLSSYTNIEAIAKGLEWLVHMFDVEYANKEIAFEGML